VASTTAATRSAVLVAFPTVSGIACGTIERIDDV
jgi:hypothetical protein